MKLLLLSLSCLMGLIYGVCLKATLADTSPHVERRSAEVTPINFKALQTKMQIHQGRVVLMDFWGSWCGPCRKSMPETIDLAEKYSDLVVMTAAIRDTETAASRLLGSLGAPKSMVNLLYTGDLSDLTTAYGYPGYIPYMILVSKRGDVFPYSETKLVELLGETK